MMSHKKMRTVKGFTLMELIIVLAIIGILLGILTPSMMQYYRRSRLQTANNNAKMVYNAAQTAVQRINTSDRSAATPSGFDGAVVKISSVNGTISNATGSNLLGANDADATACTAVATSVNRTVSGADAICWGVYVDNYIVKAAVAAQSDSSPHVGFYTVDKQVATLDSSRATFTASVDSRLATLAGLYDTYASTR